jgi:signal transduction histidine kinase
VETQWRRTLRARLWAVLALTVVAFASTGVVDLLTSARVDSRLTALEADYLPLLEFGPELDARYEDLRRAMQDVVGTQDLEGMAALQAKREHILLSLDAAPAIIGRADIDQVRKTFITWYASAYAITVRLISGETGEALVAGIAEMHDHQRAAWQAMRAAVSLDKSRMSQVFRDVAAARAQAANTRLTVVLVLLATLAAAALSIGRRLSNGLRALLDGFSRFGAGQFDTPIRISGGDELSDLSRAANEMAARLRDGQARLDAKHLELQRANGELEAFSYSVSHDLRAPLRGIDGFSQALLEDYGEQLDATGKDYLRRVRQAAQRMAELIDDMLSLSRINRADLKRERVDLSATCRRIAAQLQGDNATRRAEWVIPDVLHVEGDKRLLTAALENLLGNAWKFTGKHASPRIEVGEATSDGERVYFVRDNGAGFDMAYANKLFGAFQRLHAATEYEGTGIGLATVARIVHRHGGRIWAEAAVNNGATFYFTLAEKEMQ